MCNFHSYVIHCTVKTLHDLNVPNLYIRYVLLCNYIICCDERDYAFWCACSQQIHPSLSLHNHWFPKLYLSSIVFSSCIPGSSFIPLVAYTQPFFNLLWTCIANTVLSPWNGGWIIKHGRRRKETLLIFHSWFWFDVSQWDLC